MTLVSQKFDFV